MTFRIALYVVAAIIAVVLVYDWVKKSRDGDAGPPAGPTGMGSPIIELGEAYRRMHTERDDR